jgi:5-methylcytosine-specific restriction protein A
VEEIDESGFQIWGIPSGAKAVLRDLKIDDYLLLLRAVGPGGTFAYGGKIVAKPSVECFELSRHLWGEGRFPLIVLLSGGLTNYSWYDFCDQLSYKRNWNPAGQTYRIPSDRLHASPFGDEAALIRRIVGHDFTTAGRRAVDDFELQDPAELDIEDEEGRRILREHLHSERSARLVAAFKRQLGNFICCACGFDFKKAYGDLGDRYVECHHIRPISEMRAGDKTRLSDLVPVCANCHRMIHRSVPMKSISELKETLAAQFLAGNRL